MAGRRTDLGRAVWAILQHTGPMPAEAEMPWLHYHRAITDSWATLNYTVRKIGTEGVRERALQRHMTHLYRMTLVQVIEAFERFLKELAAVCIDHLAEFVLDKRFDEFQLRGSVLPAHFQAATLGKALCESDTWLDCKDVNDRFRKVLAAPFDVGQFYVFPIGNQPPTAEQFRAPILNVLWQLRHTIVHNVGVVTHSDAVKFRLMTQEPVVAPCVLLPTRDDLRHVTRFLDESAESVNRRIGERLAELLTALHAARSLAFVPQERADLLTRQFNVVLTVAGAVGVLPPL